MSVPAGERKPNKLQVILDARSLASYTIRICKNPKVFVPEYQQFLTSDIVKTAKDIYIGLWSANNIYVKSEADYAERKRLQKEAAINCNNLLALISLAKPVFHLSGKRVQYWGSNTIKVRNLTRAWIESDSKRYSSI